ncbi:MAG: Fur family transcriptional regulator [Clostridium sp.]
MDTLSIIFKENNLKLTPQRYAIYNYLKSTKSHPSAEVIYDNLKTTYPTMSLATVYKTLKTLIELNLVHELNVGEDNFRFDACTDTHPHIVCTKCKCVDDIEEGDFSCVDDIAKKHTKYDISRHKIYFYGVCPECK